MRLKTLAFIAVFGFASASVASAQETETPQALTEVFACRSITDNAARLACYDRAVGTLETAEQSGQLVAVDTVQARRLEREAFGFNLPSLARILPDLARSDSPMEERLDNVQMRIASVRPRGYRRYVFEMENGQRWASVDVLPDTQTRHFRRGTNVTIRSAAVGSFLMTGPSGPAHRVQREQ